MKLNKEERTKEKNESTKIYNNYFDQPPLTIHWLALNYI
jgi:hypothetical protein